MFIILLLYILFQYLFWIYEDKLCIVCFVMHIVLFIRLMFCVSVHCCLYIIKCILYIFQPHSYFRSPTLCHMFAPLLIGIKHFWTCWDNVCDLLWCPPARVGPAPFGSGPYYGFFLGSGSNRHSRMRNPAVFSAGSGLAPSYRAGGAPTSDIIVPLWWRRTPPRRGDSIRRYVSLCWHFCRLCEMYRRIWFSPYTLSLLAFSALSEWRSP